MYHTTKRTFLGGDRPGTMIRWKIAPILFLLLSGILAPSLGVVSAEGPKGGMYFKYDYKEYVTDGQGEYSGYSETTDGNGRYDVLSKQGDDVQMRARYSWHYSNSEGKSESSREDRQFSFSVSTRSYTSSEIDLDDDYLQPYLPGDLCQWLWVPTDVEVGDDICILEETWTVTDTNALVWTRSVPKRLIEVTVQGDDSRDDDYGQFTYDYTDRLYFDKETGMFVAERYEELDDGNYGGVWASFKMVIEIDVTESSYPVPVDWLTIIGIVLIIVLIILGIWYLARRIRWRKRRIYLRSYGGGVLSSQVEVRRVWKAGHFPRLQNNATDNFGPFLQHWVEKAMICGDRVLVATNVTYGLIGIAFYNPKCGIGTILCKNTELTEHLRSIIKCKDFFSEVDHEIEVTAEMNQDPELMAILQRFGKGAYNKFETYKIYRLDEIMPTSYDTELVRPLEEKDIPGLLAAMTAVYSVDGKKWVKGYMDSGDIGYVAKVNGQIVGFGFACVCGQYGRLHMLGVVPDHRGKGIAKELHRARLEAMRLMGVTSVIDEIASWNLPSIRISSLSGFRPVGKMYVETIRTKKISMNIVRR